MLRSARNRLEGGIVHSSAELADSSFAVGIAGRDGLWVDDLFPGFDEHDRLGVVVRHPLGALGASTAILAAVTAFYDVQRARGGEFFIYPDYFLFHVGRRRGDHNMLDVWPDHKEVVVADDAEEILRAINDRGVTRLLVEERPRGEPSFERETLASARARIATSLAYSPDGRVPDDDVRIAGNEVTERYVASLLDPDTLARDAEGSGLEAYARLVRARAAEVTPDERLRIQRTRTALIEDGRPVETYRRIELDNPLAML
jgi:hypothetical protein